MTELRRPPRQTRPEQIAEAFSRVAKANHYMIGFIGKVTLDELDAAEQCLIALENADRERYGQPTRSKRYDLAFELLNQHRITLLKQESPL